MLCIEIRHHKNKKVFTKQRVLSKLFTSIQRNHLAHGIQKRLYEILAGEKGDMNYLLIYVSNIIQILPKPLWWLCSQKIWEYLDIQLAVFLDH